jgi:hypothetical protein
VLVVSIASSFSIFSRYSSANDTSSAIKRLVPSYRTRSITKRTSLSNGTTLASAHYGPDVSTTYPLGSYLEDYQYVSGYGDLDQYNGRWCKTPGIANFALKNVLQIRIFRVYDLET